VPVHPRLRGDHPSKPFTISAKNTRRCRPARVRKGVTAILNDFDTDQGSFLCVRKCSSSACTLGLVRGSPTHVRGRRCGSLGSGALDRFTPVRTPRRVVVRHHLLSWFTPAHTESYQLAGLRRRERRFISGVCGGQDRIPIDGGFSRFTHAWAWIIDRARPQRPSTTVHPCACRSIVAQRSPPACSAVHPRACGAADVR
jgi:hypothetical protein